MCSNYVSMDMLQENVLVKNLNISLAFFINSCLSLVDRSFIFHLIKLYCKAVRTKFLLLIFDDFMYWRQFVTLC